MYITAAKIGDTNMPTISVFYGILVRMFFYDKEQPLPIKGLE
jgi:hypothetical protein